MYDDLEERQLFFFFESLNAKEERLERKNGIRITIMVGGGA